MLLLTNFQDYLYIHQSFLYIFKICINNKWRFIRFFILIKFSRFKSSNKSILYKLFYNFFFIIFFSYIQKYLKIYQLNIISKIKKDYKKNLVKDIKIFLKKKKKKSNNMVMNATKISHKTKNKCFLSTEKNIIE